MESLVSYNVSNPLLIDKISSIVFWRRSANYTESNVFLPNNICRFGFTLKGDLLVKNKTKVETLATNSSKHI